MYTSSVVCQPRTPGALSRAGFSGASQGSSSRSKATTLRPLRRYSAFERQRHFLSTRSVISPMPTGTRSVYWFVMAAYVLPAQVVVTITFL